MHKSINKDQDKNILGSLILIGKFNFNLSLVQELKSKNKFTSEFNNMKYPIYHVKLEKAVFINHTFKE